MRFKKIATVGSVILVSLGLVGCNNNSSNN